MLHNALHNTQVKTEAPAMEKGGPATTKAKDDKPEPKDLRINPPTKVKLPPIIKPGPPPVRDKPNKVLPNKTNGDVAPVSLKVPEEKEADQFDGLDLPTEKLSHPTANRAKPPQRRLPSGLAIAAQSTADQTDAESSPKKFQTETDAGLQKTTDNLLPTPAKPDHRPKTSLPVRPTPPKVLIDNKTVNFKEEPTVESLQAEIKELKMALELLEKRQERDMQEVKEELKEERNKRLALQEEVYSLRMKQ